MAKKKMTKLNRSPQKPWYIVYENENGNICAHLGYRDELGEENRDRILGYVAASSAKEARDWIISCTVNNGGK
jgi:hypothetical protein